MKPHILVVYAIAAVMLVLLATSLYQYYFQQRTLNEEIREALYLAKTSAYLGKFFEIGTRNIKEETIISKGTFESPNYSLAFECNSPQKCCSMGETCEKEIEWDYTKINHKGGGKVFVSARCIIIERLPVCRVYFGNLPAQAEIKEVRLLENNEGSIGLEIIVSNGGENILAFGSNSIKIFEKAKGLWEETDKEIPPKQIDSLLPGEEHTFDWAFQIATPGEYRAEIKFEGPNAGFDTNYLQFNVETGLLCKIDESKTETIAIVGTEQFQEIHYCIGCSQAYECADAWEAKQPGKDFEPLSSEQTYCIKNSYKGSC